MPRSSTIKFTVVLISFLHLAHFPECQSIGTFNSITPTAQTQGFVLPSTHTFQRIIKTGDPLSLGGTLGNNLDFTGYVPITGSTRGYLSISSESAPAECAILNVTLNSATKLWQVNSGGKVSFPFADLGNIAAFCSGTVTPRKTVIVGEEVLPTLDANNDGYQDVGWTIEIDPATRTVINQDGVSGPDKLWAVGRQAHENVTVNAAETVMYWGADAPTTGYIYKFIPSTPAKYSKGALYVLKTTAALGTGTWKLVANNTKSERNNTVAGSALAGAYNFNGIEDVEIGLDGKVYFAAKASGRIYRFHDLGASVDHLEVFVESANYDVDGAGPIKPEPWGLGNDNLAFDNSGNLWVMQDGGKNFIWVVGPAHTAVKPAVRLFATTPLGSEPTGITFSPDNKFIFLSFQHPNSSNTASQTDAAGKSVVFNAATTVVIARKENLGAGTSISINNPTITEGNTGTKNVSFQVTLNTRSAVPVSVKYKTVSNTAGLTDYTAKSGTVTFPVNNQIQTILIPVVGDLADEVNETFKVVLNEAVNAAIANTSGICTITDDDPPPAIRVIDTSTTENKQLAVIRVSLTRSSGKTVSIKYDTRSGSAVSTSDYTAILNGSLSFSPGQNTKYINVTVKKDNVNEATESFQLLLKLPVNATITAASGGKSAASVRILNSAGTTVANSSKIEDENVDLNIRAVPNPSTNDFLLFLEGNSDKLITLRVVDMAGKEIEKKPGLQNNSSTRVGAGWAHGTYLAELIQGNNKKTIKLIKSK